MLVPCPRCQCHVRVFEPYCPFCQEQLNSDQLKRLLLERPLSAPAGLKRALVYAVGTGALVLTACEGPDGDQPTPIEPRESASGEQADLPPTEPDIQYELQWRTLSDKELCALVHPEPCPPPSSSPAKAKRVGVPRLSYCASDSNSDPLYGGCF